MQALFHDSHSQPLENHLQRPLLAESFRRGFGMQYLNPTVRCSRVIIMKTNRRFSFLSLFEILYHLISSLRENQSQFFFFELRCRPIAIHIFSVLPSLNSVVQSQFFFFHIADYKFQSRPVLPSWPRHPTSCIGGWSLKSGHKQIRSKPSASY